MKTRFLTTIVTLFVATSLFAYDFQDNNVYYNITGNNTVEVTYCGWQRYSFSVNNVSSI